MIMLKDLPLPPSINRSYQSVMRGNHSTIIATRELNLFKAKMQSYRVRNLNKIKAHSEEIKAWISEGFVLHFDLIVGLPHDQVFTKTKKAKSKYKRIDVDNRLKSIRDAVADILGIDDSIFFSGNTEKVVSEVLCTTVIIRKTTVKTMQEALSA